MSSGPSMTSAPAKSDDRAWAYGKLGLGKKNNTICLFCNKRLKGGGITRLKHHLAGVKGEVEARKNVPMDVKCQMNQLLEGYKQDKERRERISKGVGEGASYQALDEEEEESLLDRRTSGDGTKKKRSKTICGFFAPRTTQGAQPSIKSALPSKQTIDEARMAVARWCVREIKEYLLELREVTRYICNHAWLHNTMRKDFANGRDLCRPGVTRPSFTKKKEVARGMIQALTVLVPDEHLQDQISAQIVEYKQATGDFNMPLAIRQREKLPPDNLLFQYAYFIFATGCERNWSTFEFIHSKRQNRLKHKRLNDLVYVRYNLKLQERIIRRTKDALDPISIENIDVLDDWVSEEPSLLDEEDIAWEIIEPPSLEALTLDDQEPNFDDAADDFPNENESQ
ncbi:hypothetical protein RHSIM_Rhsim08G0149200 [Rhododendron simsii]|uniref:BED-type domain-containing protein n=1 Tax=Rhododendron simsii TaxID=118357 RepID=A0A834GHA8_RHOSS|nr:hypothetical protein RHSIM_Rhsim08G0149200 [Rhododendron simsii]